MEDLKEKIEALVSKVTEERKEAAVYNPNLMVTYGSKFAKIGEAPIIGTKSSYSGMGSVFAFVALVDSETKGLGKVRAGDFMKAANYSTPARHARGNVLDGTASYCVYGASYRYR